MIESHGRDHGRGESSLVHPLQVPGIDVLFDMSIGATTAAGKLVSARSLRAGTDLLIAGGTTGNYIASAINGNPAVQGNGSSDWYKCTTIDLPAPSVAVPVWVWAVMRWDTYTGFDTLFAANDAVNNKCAVFQSGTASNIRQSNGTNANDVSAPVGSWGRLEAIFTGSAADSLRWKNAVTSVASASGGDPPSGISVLSRFGGAGSIVGASIAMIACGHGVFAPYRAALDAYVTTRFGAGLV